MVSETTTEELVEQWSRARASLKDAKQRVAFLECDLENSQNALGRRLVPADAMAGESFCVWTRIDRKQEVLIQATKVDEHTFKLSIRK